MSLSRDIYTAQKINAGHGKAIFVQTTTGMYLLDCNHQTMSRHFFNLCDVAGNIIDLRRNRIYFSIVLSRVRDEYQLVSAKVPRNPR